MIKCTICNDTGKRAGSDYLDCGHCGAAEERAAMIVFAADHRDPLWPVHQRARQIEREEHAEAAKLYKAQIDDLDQQNTALTNECRGMQAEKEAQAARIAELERDLSQHKAARIAYASEFPLDENGEPDIGNIHANIRALKAQAATPSAPAVEKQPVGYTCQYDLDCLANYNNATIFPVFDEDISPIALYAAPLAADTDKVREAIDRLPAEIMNLRCARTMSHFATTDDMKLYKEGHRDARHAAVELVLSAVWGAPSHEVPADWKLVPVSITEDMHVAAVKAIIRSTGNDDCPPNVWKAMLAAAPVASMAAQAPVREVPGYKLVPLEVTDAMLEAWKTELCVPIGSSPEAKARRAYRAMLAAAPVQQEGE